jgi:hypothetical protein
VGTIFLAHLGPQVCFWEIPTYPNPPTFLILLTPSPPTSFCAHYVFCFGDEEVEGWLWTFWDFRTKPHVFQQIMLEATTNKKFVLQNLNENQDFLLQTILNLCFQEYFPNSVEPCLIMPNVEVFWNFGLIIFGTCRRISHIFQPILVLRFHPPSRSIWSRCASCYLQEGDWFPSMSFSFPWFSRVYLCLCLCLFPSLLSRIHHKLQEYKFVCEIHGKRLIENLEKNVLRINSGITIIRNFYLSLQI